MGTLQKLSYLVGKKTGTNKKFDEKIAMTQPEKCTSCATCARVCPMQLQPFKELGADNQLANDDCIRCSSCVAYCPKKVLSLSPSPLSP